MARTFATGLPPLRNFGGSLSRYRYLVARAPLVDLARVTLGSRPPELLRHRLLRQIGKLASLLAVTVTPQKDINVRPPVGGPCLLGGVLLSNWFFLSSFSLGR